MLPIALKSFHIKNYRGIIDTQIDNIPPDTQWIFLTGENGFGKTSVLQGIALASTANLNPDAKILVLNNEDSKEPEDCKIEIYSQNSIVKLPYERIDGNSLLIDIMLLYKIAAYGSSRLRVASDVSTEMILNKFPSTKSLFTNDYLLLNIEQYFKDWYKEDTKGFKQLEKVFKTLLPKLDKILVEFKEKQLKVRYFEKDDSENLYKHGALLDDLAAGYKNIIAMIGDLIFRLYLTQNKGNFNDLECIVLIDEIELHLHPKYQKLFVQKLTELFPKIQFIVSTHSPIPLLGAPKNSVIINVSRTREEGIKAELLDIDFSVLTPNAILSSPIFGFQDLIPESKSDDVMIRSEDTYKEVLFNDQLDKQISEYLTEDNQKELLDLLKENNL